MNNSTMETLKSNIATIFSPKRKAEDKTGESPEDKRILVDESPPEENVETVTDMDLGEISPDNDSTVTNDDSFTSSTTSSSVTLSPVTSEKSIKIEEGDNITSVLNKILSKLNDLGKSYHTLAKSSEVCANNLRDTTSEVIQLRRDLKTEKDKVAKLELENVKLRKSHEMLDAKIINIELEFKKCNLVFDGFTDSADFKYDECKGNVVSALNYIPDFYGQAHSVPIRGINKEGYYRRGQLRSTVVEFLNHSDVHIILKGKRNLPPGVYVREQLPEELERQRNTMLQIYIKAKSMDEYKGKCRMEREKLIIKNKIYTVKNLDELPHPDLSPKNLCERSDNETVAFFGKGSPLSNFHLCNINYDGYMFTSVEQILQSEKAELSCEYQTQARILMTDDPVEIKKISKQIPYIEQQWMRESVEIVNKACYLKFAQNPELLQHLMATKNKMIIEASHDMFWGVGVHIKDKNILDHNRWKGDNRLGEILMNVRDRFSMEQQDLVKNQSKVLK